jgi:hypothetical protein
MCAKFRSNFPDYSAAQQNVVKMQLRSHWAADTATLVVCSSAAAIDWQGLSGGW